MTSQHRFQDSATYRLHRDDATGAAEIAEMFGASAEEAQKARADGAAIAVRMDARKALVEVGMTELEAADIVDRAYEDDMTAEEVVQRAADFGMVA